MLNVGIIGIGNTGNQIAALAKKELSIPVIAINSSETDLETIPSDIPRKLIKGKGETQGAGKDRELAKEYLEKSVEILTKDSELREMVTPLDVVFIISSTGGGTGSGTAPLMASIISQTYKDTKCILVGVCPVNDEALSAHVNTLEYLNELYELLGDQTYMLYDNDKCNLPSYQILEKVNREVVEDINVIRCFYNFSTKFDSIDDRDEMRLISFPGRIMVSRIMGFKEKDCDNQTIEDMLIDNIKRNCHVEGQRDRKVMASGLITNLSQNLSEEFDTNIPAVREFIGDPIHAFNHIYVNEERSQPNNVFLISTGLSPVNDKIGKITDRIEEIQEKQKILEEENALDREKLSDLSKVISDKKKDDDAVESVNLKDIFAKFKK